MHIVMLAPFGIRPKGTLAARMLPLGRALVRRGHRVTIVAPPVHNPEDAGTRVILGGVTVIHTPRGPQNPAVAAAGQAFVLYAAALRKRPDLLHLFKPKGYAGLAALLARVRHPRLPLVVDTDDWEGWGGWNDLLPYPVLAKQLFAWQEQDLPRRADAVTVASRALETLVLGMGVPPARIVYVPNGTEYSAPPPQIRASNRILLYTRFWEFSLPPLIAALVGIITRRPDARLVVVGRGERGEERHLLSLAERAGIAGNIDYRGWLQPEQIPAVLAESTLALAPMDDTLINRTRGLAKLLELMAAGLPIVASRVGQAAEYLRHGASALLVEPNDPGELAAATLRLLQDAALREHLSCGALAAAAHFSWDRLAETAEQAYQKLIERTKGQ
jgi:glycosyltransferase involved in cell wall biosynthesis